ncbi:PREDICTED: CB1 cannabinoid receptor-interacting protein 1-like [Atta cephalotes]|uniref:CB1 cannabinoid receptor-interacting protein 1 n=1 Tax=Atta cephalotes TaxID=12957 RepID=A0A158NNA3_ATTCE|nr:PREDICTED: CB1 cannabinoid receptor-interacting protein 1-like [Atta cephalotes]XP_018057930.1 PREDICTED: CB1 cannabinoid receptor-interacting protein 1-like [Atta colombica]
MGADGHFRVTLSLKKEPGAGPVFCKMETSARFRQLKTVKLSCDTTYRLDISFKPPQLLQFLSIGGKQVEAVERARNTAACAYSAYHSTKDIPASARGHREDLPIAMRVLGSGYLTTCLQIKYYRLDDQSHCEWGARLHCIELDCSSVEGRLVTVDRETYRKLGIES